VKTANGAARARGRSIVLSVFSRIPLSVTLQVSQSVSQSVERCRNEDSCATYGASFVCVDSRIVLIMQWDRGRTVAY
jgi:hypothetical protein